MDFTVVRTPDAILERARRFATRYPYVTDQIELSVPPPLAKRCASPGDWNGIVMPKVSEIEPILRRMVATPGALIGHDSEKGADLAEIRH